MYKIPANIDLSFLIGSELIQVCVGRFQLIFTFEPGGSISIEGSFEIVDGQNTIAWNQESSDVHLPITKLFGTKVSKYAVENERALVIMFDNKLLLRIFDNFDQYESFQIYGGAKQYII